MKILITGARGFIGKNLISELKNRGYTDLFEFDMDTDPSSLESYARNCDFVYHLAGVNRPRNQDEYMEGNFGFSVRLIDALKKNNNTCPVMFASSIQAEVDNEYGRSKRAAEKLFFEYGKQTGARVLVYRFQNVFGKWCRPNYNSVIATFCHNISRDLPITINDRNTQINLVYIDDLVEELINALHGKENRQGDFCAIPISYKRTLGEIADLIQSFKSDRETLNVPDMGDDFIKKLYSTYLSYLPVDQFSYPLKMNMDARGSFTEIIRTKDRGQFSVNVIKPGVTKGNHWHHTKTEKFLAVSGKGLVRLRRIDSDEIIDYHVSGERMEVVDIPAGYTHNITNTGDEDLVVFMWANEPFDPDKPDTYYQEV